MSPGSSINPREVSITRDEIYGLVQKHGRRVSRIRAALKKAHPEFVDRFIETADGPVNVFDYIISDLESYQ